jgi:hypothetical protein
MFPVVKQILSPRGNKIMKELLNKKTILAKVIEIALLVYLGVHYI